MRQDIFHNNPEFLFDGLSYNPLFDESGTISGVISEITPEFSMILGHAASSVSERISVSGSDNGVCKLLANAFIAGAGSGGAHVTELDAGIFSISAFYARSFLFNLTFFFESDNGRIRIRVADKFGLTIDRATQRRLEDEMKKSEHFRFGDSDIPMPKSISGAQESFISVLSKDLIRHPFPVSVEPRNRASSILKSILKAVGCRIVPPTKDVLSLSSSDDGTRLFVCDETERFYDDGHILALLALIYFGSGENALAVPFSAPSVMEQIAAENDGRILRINRDPGARELFAEQKLLSDAASGALFLCHYLSETGVRACELFDKLPSFTLVSREVSVNRSRRAVLSYLAEVDDGMHKEKTDGLRICADGGWINIAPSHSKSALRITGEGMSEEIASELCNLFVEKTRFIDKNISK